MASSDDTLVVHPIVGAVAAMRACAAEVADHPVWSLDEVQTREVLVDLTRLVAQVSELQTRLLTHAGEVDAYPGLKVADGVAVATRQTRRESHAHVKLAGLIDAHDLTRAAMASGEVLADQARVICQAVDALPEGSASVAVEAELFLLAEAKHHDAKALKLLGRHLLEVVDPDAADAHAEKLLAEEEKAAADATKLTMTDDGHGQVHGRFTIPTAQAEMFKKALQAIAAPKHQRAEHGAGSYDYDKPTPQRMGEAFCEYIENYPVDELPSASSAKGVNATIVVTMTQEQLVGGLGTATLDTGEEITASQARRLACEATLIPAVLDGETVVLDLGRGKRLFSVHQRLAKTITDKHCEHPGCDVPTARCHLHHRTPWSQNGTTDLANAVWLCPRHHHDAHRNPILRT